MPLDKATLETSIKAAFEKAQKTPPPDNPDDAPKVQDQILTDLSKDLAEAINAFVISGDVANLKTSVKVDLGTGTGTGTQAGVVHIK